MDSVYTVHGVTESGDNWMLAFDYRPSDEDVVRAIQADPGLSAEWEAGCINFWNIVLVGVNHRDSLGG